MKKNQLIFILVVTFIVVMSWVVFDIIHTKASVPLNSQLNEAIEPINPEFDQTVLDQVKNTQEVKIAIPSPTPIKSGQTPQSESTRSGGL